VSRPFLTVRASSRWGVVVSGYGSWGLCKEAGKRRPAWSRRERGWIVSPQTARKVVELAEAANLGVVVQAEAEAAPTPPPACEPEQGALW
jgi:hypothetical protein